MSKLISESERSFLEDGVEQGIRNDGRNLTDFRCISIALDIISTSNGSTRVKNEELDIMVGVKVSFLLFLIIYLSYIFYLVRTYDIIQRRGVIRFGYCQYRLVSCEHIYVSVCSEQFTLTQLIHSVCLV